MDVTKLHSLSPEVISRQATINIGTIGHMVNQQSTVRFKNELERNITIKLGYANAKIYKCEDESCPQPQTSEHLAAVEIMHLKHIIILQNKIDLIQLSNYDLSLVTEIRRVNREIRTFY